MNRTLHAIAMAALVGLVVLPTPGTAVSPSGQYVDDSGFLLLPDACCGGAIYPVTTFNKTVPEQAVPIIRDSSHWNEVSYGFSVADEATTGNDLVKVQVVLDLDAHTDLAEVHVKLCQRQATGTLFCNGIDEGVSDDKTWIVEMDAGAKMEWVYTLDLRNGADVHFITKITYISTRTPTA